MTLCHWFECTSIPIYEIVHMICLFLVECHCITFQLMGELVRRTAQVDSCASSLEGGNDVKEDRAVKLQPLPYDKAERAHILRRVSSGSLDGVSLPFGHDKEGLQRLPHYKRRT